MLLSIDTAAYIIYHYMLQVSDWGACHSTYDAINAGLDIEMPHATHFTAEKIKAGLANKTLTMERINESCERILSGWYKLPPSKRYPCGGAHFAKHNKIAVLVSFWCGF
jgi:beta-glucosidase-like glycosyl hydrolase